MKKAMKEEVLKKKQTAKSFYKEEGWVQHVARSPLFEQVTLGIPLFNRYGKTFEEFV